MFCVFLYARVRLSDTAFETHLRSWSLLEDPAIYHFSHPVDWSREVFHTYWRLHCIWDILLYFISNSDFFYSSFMNYYLFIPLRIFVLLCICDSVFDLFTIYVGFCQILINNLMFWAIQVRYLRMRMVENSRSLQLVSELWL